MPRDAFEGIYDLALAAAYVRAAMKDAAQKSEQRENRKIYVPSTRHFIRWIRLGLASPDLVHVGGRDILITFEDLVSMRVIAALRGAGVSFRAVRIAEKSLRDQTGKKRPFASEALWTDSSDVFTKLQEILMAVSRGSQLAFDFMHNYVIALPGLLYEDEMAASWEPREGVMIHPEIQFGKSCIKGTRIPTSTVWGLVKGSDEPDTAMVSRVARSYQVENEDIWKAVRWEDAIAA